MSLKSSNHPFLFVAGFFKSECGHESFLDALCFVKLIESYTNLHPVIENCPYESFLQICVSNRIKQESFLRLLQLFVVEPFIDKFLAKFNPKSLAFQCVLEQCQCSVFKSRNREVVFFLFVEHLRVLHDGSDCP